ncbi:hypothetical protein chiPu_0023804, partial [Chiloscyllium punctatum]|nr:hypothetical protein [Chiloscyllium punctatum]
INTLLDISLGYVDAGTKIEHQLILKSKEFFVNGDVKVIPDPPPLTREPSKEIPKEGELTIEQLGNLHRQFMLVAPTGKSLDMDRLLLSQPHGKVTDSQSLILSTSPLKFSISSKYAKSLI